MPYSPARMNKACISCSLQFVPSGQYTDTIFTHFPALTLIEIPLASTVSIGGILVFLVWIPLRTKMATPPQLWSGQLSTIELIAINVALYLLFLWVSDTSTMVGSTARILALNSTSFSLCSCILVQQGLLAGPTIEWTCRLCQ